MRGAGYDDRAMRTDRETVRTTHVTVKFSPIERDLLLRLVDTRREERRAAGIRGAYTVSAFVRELVIKEARRRRVPARV